MIAKRSSNMHNSSNQIVHENKTAYQQCGFNNYLR